MPPSGPTLRHSSLVAASYWLPPAVMCLVLFLISSKSVPDIIPSFRFGDKLQHAAAYFLLGWLICRAVAAYPGWWSRRSAIIVVAFVAAYGVSDEIHQAFVPGRFAQVTDALADASGGALAAFVFEMKRRSGREQAEAGR